jgi:hypothetical protein
MKTGRTKPPAGKKQGVAKRKRQSLAGLMPLEPRVMYDAAGAHTAASHMVIDPHHNDTTSTPSMPERGTTGRSFWVNSIGRTERWRASIKPWRSSPITWAR